MTPFFEGSCATVGGMIAGPPGLAIGGAIGGCLAYIFGEGKFRPVSHVIMYEMKEEEKQQLVASVQNIIHNLDAGDALEVSFSR